MRGGKVGPEAGRFKRHLNLATFRPHAPPLPAWRPERLVLPFGFPARVSGGTAGLHPHRQHKGRPAPGNCSDGHPADGPPVPNSRSHLGAEPGGTHPRTCHARARRGPGRCSRRACGQPVQPLPRSTVVDPRIREPVQFWHAGSPPGARRGAPDPAGRPGPTVEPRSRVGRPDRNPPRRIQCPLRQCGGGCAAILHGASGGAGLHPVVPGPGRDLRHPEMAVPVRVPLRRHGGEPGGVPNADRRVPRPQQCGPASGDCPGSPRHHLALAGRAPGGGGGCPRGKEPRRPHGRRSRRHPVGRGAQQRGPRSRQGRDPDAGLPAPEWPPRFPGRRRPRTHHLSQRLGPVARSGQPPGHRSPGSRQPHRGHVQHH